jgi:two-component system chemotaxis response regulator CheB
MDINLPVMDGIEAIKQIMAYNPTPILVISASIYDKGIDNVFKAISYGALDVIEKKGFVGEGIDEEAKIRLLNKIKFLANVKVIRHPLASLERSRSVRSVQPAESSERRLNNRIVGMVGSTGGPQAFLEILRRLPMNFSCAIAIVQHISTGFTEGFANWLDRECKIHVKVAKDGDLVEHGVAYIAPNEFQMRIDRGGIIRLTNEPPYDGHRPSGNVILESIARTYKEGAIGVILTGMGRDGALGIKMIKEYNGKTIAQDEVTSVIFGMPKAAIDMGVVDEILPVDKIAEKMVRILGN